MKGKKPKTVKAWAQGFQGEIGLNGAAGTLLISMHRSSDTSVHDCWPVIIADARHFKVVPKKARRA